MTFWRREKEEVITLQRKRHRDYLGYLVRLRDIESSNPEQIRWEIVNACAVEDFERALSWCELFQQVLPEKADYLKGRLHFLIPFSHLGRTYKLMKWNLPITPEEDQLVNWRLYMLTVNPVDWGIDEKDRDHLRDAVKYLARDPDHALSARFMLARSYSETGDHIGAAREYAWLLQHRDRVQELWEANPFCRNCFRPLNEWLIPGLHKCLIHAYAHFNTDEAIDAAERWVKEFPDQPGTYERMARLYQTKGDFKRAYEYLQKEADRNPRFGGTLVLH